MKHKKWFLIPIILLLGVNNLFAITGFTDNKFSTNELKNKIFYMSEIDEGFVFESEASFSENQITFQEKIDEKVIENDTINYTINSDGYIETIDEEEQEFLKIISNETDYLSICFTNKIDENITCSDNIRFYVDKTKADEYKNTLKSELASSPKIMGTIQLPNDLTIIIKMII